jgi:uncharacterized protein (DUF433 family)
MKDRELLGVGLYSVPQAARLISHALGAYAPERQLRRMALGRREFEREYAPLVGGDLRVDGSHLFTFLELIELMTVVALKQKGVKPATIRRTRQVLEARYGSNPFARSRFLTDGVGIYDKKDLPNPVELSRQQIAIETVVKPLLSKVSYVDDRAATYSPVVTHGTVILNPARSFGAPINKQTSIPTYVIKGMLDAGEVEEEVADWYGITVQGVQDAAEYESALLNAA